MVTSTPQPIPLDCRCALSPVRGAIRLTFHGNRAPVCIIRFSRSTTLRATRTLTSANISDGRRHRTVTRTVGNIGFAATFNGVLRQLLHANINVRRTKVLPHCHHLIRRLTRRNLLPIVYNASALNINVGIPVRSIILATLAGFSNAGVHHLHTHRFRRVTKQTNHVKFSARKLIVTRTPRCRVRGRGTVTGTKKSPGGLGGIGHGGTPRNFIA